MTSDFMNNVYGYTDIKEELFRIKEWLNDEELITNNLVNIKGLLFVGEPGVGKSLMVTEFANSFDCKKVIIKGGQNNILEEVSDKFNSVSNEKFSLIIIDEIDKLIFDDPRIERLLLTLLDGINKNNNTLVLATANDKFNINSSLYRQGRFSRIFNISLPNKKTRKIIFKNYIDKLGVDDSLVNYDGLVKTVNNVSCAEIASIVNDCYLRVRNNFNTKELEDSYDRLFNNTFESLNVKKNKRICIHEAGHILLTLSSQYWTFYSARLTNEGGYTELEPKDEDDDQIKKREERIRIVMAGYLAEELIFGYHECGSYRDYEYIHDACTRLVERVCVYGITNLIPRYRDNDNRYETSFKRRRNEKLVKRLMKRYEAQTRKVLRKNKEKLELLANMLYEKDCINYLEISN